MGGGEVLSTLPFDSCLQMVHLVIKDSRPPKAILNSVEVQQAVRYLPALTGTTNRPPANSCVSRRWTGCRACHDWGHNCRSLSHLVLTYPVKLSCRKRRKGRKTDNIFIVTGTHCGACQERGKHAAWKADHLSWRRSPWQNSGWVQTAFLVSWESCDLTWKNAQNLFKNNLQQGDACR